MAQLREGGPTDEDRYGRRITKNSSRRITPTDGPHDTGKEEESGKGPSILRVGCKFE